MSDQINVVITEEVDVTNITITEQPPIHVNFYDIALPDPTVAEAVIRAENAANEATIASNNATLAAESAQESVDSIGEVVQEEVSDAVSALTTDELSEGVANLYFTDERVSSFLNASGIATELKQDDIITILSAIEEKDFATSAKQDLLLVELEKKADLTETQPVSLLEIPKAPALTASFQEITDLTTTAQTFTAPEGAKWCKVMTDDDNASTIRVKIGGTASSTSGMMFQAGRSEDFQAIGDISVIALSGTNNKVQVIFGV